MKLPETVRTKKGLFTLKTGREKSDGQTVKLFGGPYYAWYEPVDKTIKVSYLPIARATTEEEALKKLEKSYLEVRI